MIDLSGGLLWLLGAVVMLLAGLGIALLRAHVKHRRRNRQAIEARFWLAMQQHRKPNVKILKDRTYLGGPRRNGKEPFDVHRVLHHPPDRWFVYVHIEDSEPLLMPVSEQRALAAVKN